METPPGARGSVVFALIFLLLELAAATEIPLSGTASAAARDSILGFRLSGRAAFPCSSQHSAPELVCLSGLGDPGGLGCRLPCRRGPCDPEP